MAGGFSPQLLEEIRARVDIVDLVGQFVNLKRAGENWKGLCPFHPRQTGSGFYDRFRGRLLFPIKDGQGRVVAFGGRAMGTEDPKYLNSPETPLYVKGQTLYAFDLAKPQIREEPRALVVEGYVDCLMAHQHGFTETVAALGTAVTASPLGLLRRYCDEALTFFDA